MSVTASRIQDDVVTSNPDSRNACELCGRGLAEDEPLWRLKVRTGEHLVRSTGVSWPISKKVSACRACALPQVAEYWHDRPFELDDRQQWVREILEPFAGQLYSRCEGCDRPLGRTNYWPARHCSQACRNDSRNRRRHRERIEHRCECGRMFTARADATYCSNACRQRAYRQRGGER